MEKTAQENREVDVVSIVIPVYNHTDQLCQALNSIKNQTYSDKEVIIVDDGSDKPIESSDLNTGLDIKLHRQKNQGAPAARNKGLELAGGNFIIFWDADVVAEKEMLAKMKQKLTQHPEASYAYSNFYFGNKKMKAQEFDSGSLKENNYIHSTSLIRSKDIIKWDETLDRFQDWDLWLSMLEEGKKGVLIDKYLFKVQPRKNGMSEWLPKFAYKKPWRYIPGIKGKVDEYEQKKKKVLEKHNLIS